MASNTENLDLLMKNPSTDGADTFNVQTMLNENWQKIDKNAGTVAQTLANILKPTTPPIIGLSSSATPNDMFNVLAHAGDLHVWKKMVKNAADVPAGYTLGDVQTGNFKFVADSYRTFEFGTPSVDDAGNVGLNVEGSVNGRYNSNFDNLKGKFCRPPDSTWYIDASLGSQVIYIPADATFSQSGSYKYVDKFQLVTGYPLTPAGTTVTYPVSTNRNAYQEGNDAKPAGYTLGEVVKSTGAYGFFGMMGFAYGTSYFKKISDAIKVADDGSVSHVAPVGDISDSTVLDSASVLKERIAGKYITLSENSYTEQPYTNELPPTNAVLHIPADVNVKMIHPEGTSLSNQYALFFDRYQPVTGYAAIPANTTIEYLGCLGDKARVQVVSYVGTGTYGSSNPCSLTFDFAPKVVMFLRGYKKSSTQFNYLYGSYGGDSLVITTADLLEEFSVYNGFGRHSSAYAKKDSTGRTISWYSYESANSQANATGCTYYFLAIG